MKSQEGIFKIIGSEARFFLWLIFISISILFDIFLIQILLNNWSDKLYVLLLLIIPLTLIIALASIRVIRLLKFLINGKSLMFFDGIHISELFDHGVQIFIEDIKEIEIREQVGTFRPPVEMLIKTKSNKNGQPYVSKRLNILSFRSKQNEIVINPMFYKGNRKLKIVEICEILGYVNPKIKVKKLGVWE